MTMMRTNPPGLYCARVLRWKPATMLVGYLLFVVAIAPFLYSFSNAANMTQATLEAHCEQPHSEGSLCDISLRNFHCDNFWIPDAAQLWTLWICGIHLDIL